MSTAGVLHRCHELTRSGCAHLLFRAWPLSYGFDRLMEAVNPVPPPGPVTRRLRSFPVSLTFDPQSYVGRFLYYRGLYEDSTLAFLRHVLRPGMSLVDVGANIGLHTTIAAHLVGSSGRVVAVEPQEDLCELIGINVRQNGLHNVRIVHTALGRTSGTAVLHQLYATNPAAATLRLQSDERSLGRTVVPLRTLSDVCEQADLGSADLVVKIDVEGAELEVLSGAREFFDRKRPVMILVECMDHHLRRFGAGSLELLEVLQDLGYRLSTLHRGRRLDLVPAHGVNAEVIAWRAEHSPW